MRKGKIGNREADIKGSSPVEGPRFGRGWTRRSSEIPSNNSEILWKDPAVNNSKQLDKSMTLASMIAGQ